MNLNVKIKFAIEELKQVNEQNLKLLEKFENLYFEAIKRNNEYCDKCKDWLKLPLPVDCLCKPDYCIRNESDSDFINLYEQLQNYCNSI